MRRLLIAFVAAVSLLHIIVAAQQVTPNVNVLAGTDPRTGDAFLQRQNEAVVAVSTRNSDHRDQRLILGVDHDVFRLQITMNDTSFVRGWSPAAICLARRSARGIGIAPDSRRIGRGHVRRRTAS